MSTGLTDTIHLRRCRAALAEARVAAQLAKDEHERERAQAEWRAAISGKNESERKTALAVALAADERYQGALAGLRAAEAEVIRAEAELEAAQDQRRAEEWQVRLALVNALDRASVPSDAPGDDTSFDDAADAVGTDAIETYARVKAQHVARIEARERDTAEWFGR
jgi:hypothetical protein